MGYNVHTDICKLTFVGVLAGETKKNEATLLLELLFKSEVTTSSLAGLIPEEKFTEIKDYLFPLACDINVFERENM